MSTKIRNGYRLAEGTDPFAFCSTVRKALDPVRDRLDGKLLAAATVRLIDLKWFARETIPEAIIIEAMSQWEADQAKLSETDRRHDPNRFSLTIGADPVTGRHHVMLFADAMDLIGAFEALEEVEPYGYWNDTDQPDEISAAAWDERREAWDRVLPGYAPPAESMLTFQLRSKYNPGVLSLLGMEGGDEDPILGQLPLKDQRSKDVAINAYLRHLVGMGYDLTKVVRRVAFGTDLSGIAAAASPCLPNINADVLRNGLGDQLIDTAAADAIATECEKLYASEKDALPPLGNDSVSTHE